MRAAARPRTAPRPRQVDRCAPRLDRRRPRATILRAPRARRSHADDGGDAQRAREHGCVRGRAAVRGDDAERRRRVEPGGVGGREVGGHQDAGRVEPGRRHCDAEDAREHLRAHAPQVDRSRPQVLVVERVPGGGDAVDRVVPRAGGAVALVADRGAGRLEQGLVAQEQQVRVEDARLVLAGPGGDVVALARDRFAGLADGRVECGELGQRRRSSLRRAPRAAASGIGATRRRRCRARRRTREDALGGRLPRCRGAPPAPASDLRRRQAPRSHRPARRTAGRRAPRSAAIASAASGPDARTSISWPARTPSVATAFRLVASAGPRAGREVPHGHGGVESRGGLHEPSRRAARAGRGATSTTSTATTASPSTASGPPGTSPALRHGDVPRCAILPARPMRASAADRLERHAQLGGDGRGHGALDERRLAEEDPVAAARRPSGRAPSRRRARRSRGPSARARRRRTTRVRSPASRARRRCRSDARSLGAVDGRESAGGLELDVGPAHLARELGDAFGDAVAVRDDHDADHAQASSGPRGQHADQHEAVRDRHDAERDEASIQQPAPALWDRPKSSSTERSPSIACTVTTTRNTPSMHEDDRGAM